MKKFLVIICSLSMFISIFPSVAANVEMVNIYVSPNGTGDGMDINSPIGGIENAQAKVRALSENMDSDIVVNLLGGTYYLDKPIFMNEKDSGKNGYSIIWQSVSGEKAVISGGREISGWEKHDGDIWKISIPEYFDDNFISNLYINDKVASFSRIEDAFFVGKIGDSVDKNSKTVTFKAEDVPISGDMHDALLFWDYNWRHYMFPVEKAYKNDEGNHTFELISGSPEYIISTNYLPPSYNFIAANAYSFIDRPGEFYYDRSERIIYYLKDENEDLIRSKTVVPYLDYLWRIEGETTANPVENIQIKNITFSHSMCQRNYKYGLYVNQGLQSMNKIDEAIDDITYMFSNRGAVEVLNAENLKFEGNTFEKMDNVGLAMYAGVYDTKVCGNLFQDISDTAICVGETPEDQMELEKKFGLTEISARKPFSVSDVEVNNWYGVHNIPASDIGAWHQIDLEDKHKISKVYFKLGTIPAKATLEVRASNIENFGEYEILARIPLKNSKWKISENEYAVTIGDPTKYRYIRLVNPYGELSVEQHRIYSDNFNGGFESALCERLDITDNLLNRVVREHWSSAAIHVFSARYMNISNNEIDGCPYTGISLGWGWDGGPDMPGIKINYNYIKNSMQRSHDGAAIYVLGTHTDSEIKGNYISGSINGMGGIYTDNGSCYWRIEENVIENVNVSLHPWSADQHDITIKNNYTTVPYYVIGAQRTTMENTELYVRGYMPEHIKEKAQLAGIREEYVDVYAGVVGGKAPWSPILIDGYPAPQCYGPHYFWNEAFSYLQSVIAEAENILRIAKMSNLVAGYEEETELFESRIKDMLEIYNAEFERDRYYEAVRLTDMYIDEYLSSGLFEGKKYKQIFQNYGVVGEATKAGDTVINSDKPIYLDMMVDDFDHLMANGGSVLLNREKTGFTLTKSNGGVTYYTANRFGDVTFEGKVKFDYANEYDWQGIVLRASNVSGMPGTAGFDCYIIDFQDYSIEVQRFNNGERTVFYGMVGDIEPVVAPTLDYSGWKRNALSDIKVTTKNESNGVRIIFEANGNQIFNILDDSKDAIIEPGYIGIVSPAGTVEVESVKNESKRYNDLFGYDWAKTPVYQLSYIDAIDGTDAGVFNPNSSITRAEYSKILARIIGVSGNSTTFSDISENEWYFAEVAGLDKIGAYRNVYGGVFDAEKPITREEMAAIAMKALKGKGDFGTTERGVFSDSEQISSHLADSVLEYAALGLISGKGNGIFAPKETATRAEAAKLLYNLYSAQEVIK